MFGGLPQMGDSETDIACNRLSPGWAPVGHTPAVEDRLPTDAVVAQALEAHARGDVDGTLGPFMAVASDWDEEALSAALISLINADPEALVTLALDAIRRLQSTGGWLDPDLQAERDVLEDEFQHGVDVDEDL